MKETDFFTVSLLDVSSQLIAFTDSTLTIEEGGLTPGNIDTTVLLSNYIV